MIEFRGILTGSAQKRFLKRTADYGQRFFLAGEILVLPIIILVAVLMQNSLVIWGYLIYSAVILLLARMPKSKRERALNTPKRIYTEEDEIVCVAERYIERRYIADVTCVRDFGEFYELVFRFGRVSDKFICQKELLVQGSLEDFESLFEGKVIRP